MVLLLDFPVPTSLSLLSLRARPDTFQDFVPVPQIFSQEPSYVGSVLLASHAVLTQFQSRNSCLDRFNTRLLRSLPAAGYGKMYWPLCGIYN